ncbi:hypothetical protein ACTHSJ_33505 [Paenibacillus cellulositrophicus]|uniref:hypothetical protein n=1 Tax=Paenibacillus cellulositrophicus TaxID=562959 RepID=UPI003F8119FA
MSFYLQQGYGMSKINEEFSKKFRDNLGIILAPRSLQVSTDISRLEKHSKQLKKNGTKVLFDPQFYVPSTNLEKIIKFPYFKNLTFQTIEFNNKHASKFCDDVINYQVNQMLVDDIILPNRYINAVTSEWLEMQERFVDCSLNLKNDKKAYLTLALGPDVVLNHGAFDDLISNCVNYDVDGFYVVLKAPNDMFLIDNEDYIYSLLDAFLSLRLAGKEIILGYANQQSIIYSAVGVNHIASGNFRNVRSFDPDIFAEVEGEDDEILRRGTWYYDGNSLSEFKKEQLSLAYRRNIKEFGPKCEYCEPLLDAPNPAIVLWKEPSAFKHYLFELRNQWNNLMSVKASERIDAVIRILEKTTIHNASLKNKGFKLGSRGFNEKIMDSTLSALSAIKEDRKLDLRQLD